MFHCCVASLVYVGLFSVGTCLLWLAAFLLIPPIQRPNQPKQIHASALLSSSNLRLFWAEWPQIIWAGWSIFCRCFIANHLTSHPPPPGLTSPEESIFLPFPWYESTMIAFTVRCYWWPWSLFPRSTATKPATEYYDKISLFWTLLTCFSALNFFVILYHLPTIHRNMY